MSDNLDILFLGRLFSKKNEDAIRRKAKTDMQDAANVLQWNLIDGFYENGCENISVVSYLPIDSWPNHYDDSFVKSQTHTIRKGITFEQVGFCNITKLKQLCNTRLCNKKAVQWAARKTDAKKVIVCYSCNNTLMRAVAAAKHKDPNILAIQVIADITEFAANNDPTFVQRLFIKGQIRTNEHLKQYIDGYVLLTRQMKEKLGITKPCMVMEGIVPTRSMAASKQLYNDCQKTILYTGSLNKKYGILTLLEAFSHITDPSYRLVICGLGNAEAEIRDRMQDDDRIEFKGKVPHNEVLLLQEEATVLVNPRQNTEEFTKYSFPSKTLEYLASGVPVIAYKLDGIPDEYDSYISYVPDNTPQALASVITHICSQSDQERKAMGVNARAFILSQKNKEVQTGRILDFIRNLLAPQ